MNKLFAEGVNIAAGFVPVDMAAGANNGDWISLKNYGRCTVVLFKAAGVAGDDPILTLEQATDVAGTGAKALNFTRIDVKQGAALTALGTFTTVTQAAANTYTDATSAEVQAIWVVDVTTEMLDINGGFDCIRASVADVGAGGTQLGAMLYLVGEPRQGIKSAIVD